MTDRDQEPTDTNNIRCRDVGEGAHRPASAPGSGNAASWRALAPLLGLWLLLCMPGLWTHASAADRAATLAVCALLFPLVVTGPWPVRLLIVGAMWALGAVQFIYFLAIGSPIDSYFWLTVSTTDWQEVSGFLSQQSIYLIVQSAGWAALTALGATVLLTNPLPGRASRWWAMASWLLIGSVALIAGLHDDPARFIAKNFAGTYQYRVWRSWNTRSQLAASFRSVIPHPGPPPSAALANTVVLVIGESSARSRWQAFGYEAQTNRFLQSRTDVVKFGDVVSNANVTAAAVPMLLAGKPLSALSPTDPTLLDLAHRAGFEVTVATNQGRFSDAEDLFGVMLRRADHFVQVGQGDFDEVLTMPLKEAIARAGRQFVVLHTYGSHHTASKRTPRRYKSLPDEYDNSIAYTDRLLAEWIGLLEHQGGSSVLLYISDHGVETERCHGRYMHGSSTNSYEVPMLLWASKDLRKATGARSFRHLLKNSHLPYQNTVAFTTLADVFGYPALHYPSALQASQALPARFAGELPYEEVPPPERCGVNDPS